MDGDGDDYVYVVGPGRLSQREFLHKKPCQVRVNPRAALVFGLRKGPGHHSLRMIEAERGAMLKGKLPHHTRFDGIVGELGVDAVQGGEALQAERAFAGQQRVLAARAGLGEKEHG